MKQYVPLKPVKRGFKVWAMADAVNGYMYDFDVYTRAKGRQRYRSGREGGADISRIYQRRHHQLYFDNFFTSISLLSKLLAQGTYGCGTVRTNRKQYPSEISVEAQRFKCGESTFRNIVATAWKDNKVVNVASTLASPMDITSVNRRQKDGTRVPITCPKCVELYNKHMGGVDEDYYHVRLKCTKKYKYIFWFMYDVGVTNAFILHSKFDVTTGTPMTQKQFRVKLAEQLIGDYCSRKRTGRPRKRSCPPNNTPTSITHLPSHSKSTRCVYCRDVRSPPRRKESVWVCTVCEGHPSLCLTRKEDGSECFRLWHEQ